MSVLAGIAQEAGRSSLAQARSVGAAAGIVPYLLP